MSQPIYVTSAGTAFRIFDIDPAAVIATAIDATRCNAADEAAARRWFVEAFVPQVYPGAVVIWR